MRNKFVREEEDDGVDITPMIDIVFIMLIFFVVTASFVKESGIDINKPEAVTAQPKKRAGILIAISEDNEVWIDKQPVDVRAVRANIERLLAENPQAGVVIQADAKSHTGTFAEVYDAAKLTGAQVSMGATKKE